MNAFTFCLEKHEISSNKLIVTKSVPRTIPMFNNKTFLAVTEKLS